MSKQSKVEKRLEKLARKPVKLDDEITLILTPKLFGFVKLLCERYLQTSKFDPPSRDLVARFAFAFRQEAFNRFGHDSVETFILGNLIKAAQQNSLIFKPKPGRVDSISHIQYYTNKNNRFDSEQQTAAEHIQRVWQAFGKFLVIGGRSMEGGGSPRGQVLSPLDVMGEELWDHYKTLYKPWYKIASQINIHRIRAATSIKMTAITFKILVEDFWPEEVDDAFALVKGTSLRTLKAALSAYWSPERLLGYGKKLPKPAPDGQRAPLAAVSGAAGGKGQEAA